MQILSNPTSALNVRESPKFTRLIGNRGRGTRWWRQIYERKWKYGRFLHAHCNWTISGWVIDHLVNFRTFFTNPCKIRGG